MLRREAPIVINEPVYVCKFVELGKPALKEQEQEIQKPVQQYQPQPQTSSIYKRNWGEMNAQSDDEDDYDVEDDIVDNYSSHSDECNDWESDEEVDVYESTWRNPVYQYSGNDAWD